MVNKIRRIARHRGRHAARCSLMIQVFGGFGPLKYNPDVN